MNYLIPVFALSLVASCAQPDAPFEDDDDRSDNASNGILDGSYCLQETTATSLGEYLDGFRVSNWDSPPEFIVYRTVGSMYDVRNENGNEPSSGRYITVGALENVNTSTGFGSPGEDTQQRKIRMGDFMMGSRILSQIFMNASAWRANLDHEDPLRKSDYLIEQYGLGTGHNFGYIVSADEAKLELSSQAYTAKYERVSSISNCKNDFEGAGSEIMAVAESLKRPHDWYGAPQVPDCVGSSCESDGGGSDITDVGNGDKHETLRCGTLENPGQTMPSYCGDVNTDTNDGDRCVCDNDACNAIGTLSSDFSNYEPDCHGRAGDF